MLVLLVSPKHARLYYARALRNSINDFSWLCPVPLFWWPAFSALHWFSLLLLSSDMAKCACAREGVCQWACIICSWQKHCTSPVSCRVSFFVCRYLQLLLLLKRGVLTQFCPQLLHPLHRLLCVMHVSFFSTLFPWETLIGPINVLSFVFCSAWHRLGQTKRTVDGKLGAWLWSWQGQDGADAARRAHFASWIRVFDGLGEGGSTWRYVWL